MNGVYSIDLASDGGYILAGAVNSSVSSSDVLVLKLSSNGTVQWAKTYGGSAVDISYSIMRTTDNGYIITGYTTSFGTGTRALVIKLSEAGSVQWARTFGGSGSDIGYSVRQTSDGGYIIGGRTDWGVGNGDVLLIKLKSDGWIDNCFNLQSTNLSPLGMDVGLISHSAVYSQVSGTTATVNPVSLTWQTTQLCPLTSLCPTYRSELTTIEEVREYEPVKITPTIGKKFTISYRVHPEGRVLIRIYNTGGELLKILCDQHLTQGDYTIVWDGKDKNGQRVVSGIYFCRMEINELKVTQKFTAFR